MSRALPRELRPNLKSHSPARSPSEAARRFCVSAAAADQIRLGLSRLLTPFENSAVSARGRESSIRWPAEPRIRKERAAARHQIGGDVAGGSAHPKGTRSGLGHIWGLAGSAAAALTV